MLISFIHRGYINYLLYIFLKRGIISIVTWKPVIQCPVWKNNPYLYMKSSFPKRGFANINTFFWSAAYYVWVLYIYIYIYIYIYMCISLWGNLWRFIWEVSRTKWSLATAVLVTHCLHTLSYPMRNQSLNVLDVSPHWQSNTLY